MGKEKKHKKHKSDRWDRYESAQGQDATVADRPQLRLILKVGGGHTPDPPDHVRQAIASNIQQYSVEDESRQSSHYSYSEGGEREKHKKKKEKKKKKNKDKDKEKKKHKHHKEKKHKNRDESAPETEASFRYEVVSVQPHANSSHMGAISPRPILKISTTPVDPGPVPGPAPGIAITSTPSSSRGLRTSLRPRPERPALQKLLELLLPTLERKDPRQFFAWPVTDNIAPGYSTIIPKPMDFSTIKQKIEDNQYKTLQEFSDDFVLMCNNAMTYNQPDTVYYKAAKRLLHAGLRNLTPEKVRPFVPTISNFGELTSSHLGFEPLEESFKAFANRQEQSTDGSMDTADHDMEMGFSSGGEAVETARDIFLKKETPAKNAMEGLPDDLTSEEILEQVQEAAQMAANKLRYQHPNAKMGFMRQRKDGTTSLAILVPSDPGVPPGSKEVPISLGALTGKIQPGPGTGQLLGFREDRRNLVKPVKPLYYGPFGSYAPSYDSTFSNLSKEESDLVQTTYGEETGVPYAESILDFVRDCDHALHIADDLLNLMTHGEHSAVARILEEKRRLHQQQVMQQIEQEQLQQLQRQQQQQQQYLQSQQASIEALNLDSLRSLEDLGIDISFLDAFEAQFKAEQKIRETSQNYLNETGSLISSLERVQRERLSKTPPPHLSNIMGPSDLEMQLVEKITEGITYVAKQSIPADVVSVPGVRKAMGVAIDSLPATSSAPKTIVTGVETDRDIESELSKLLGEDGVTDADMFHN